MRRLNKEYKLDVCDHILIKYGSVNKDNPTVIYVTGRCWISPQSEMNFDNVIKDVEREMRKNIKSIIADDINFHDKFILDFDVNTDSMQINEKKFLTFDFYIRQKNSSRKELKKLKDILFWKISAIASNLISLFNENNFIVSRKK